MSKPSQLPTSTKSSARVQASARASGGPSSPSSILPNKKKATTGHTSNRPNLLGPNSPLLRLGANQVVSTLKLVKASPTIPSFIKEASDSALQIAETVGRFPRLQNLWKTFGDYVQRVTAIFVVDAGAGPENVLRVVSETQFKPLNKALEDIKDNLTELPTKPLEGFSFSGKHRDLMNRVLSDHKIDTSQEALDKISQTLSDPKRLVRKLERVEVQLTPRAPVASSTRNDAGELLEKSYVLPSSKTGGLRNSNLDTEPEPVSVVKTALKLAGTVPSGPDKVSRPFVPTVPAATREPVSESRPLAEIVSSGNEKILHHDVPGVNETAPTVSPPITVWGARSITEVDRTQHRTYETSARKDEIVQSGTSTTEEHQKATNVIHDTTAPPDAKTPRNTRQEALIYPSASVDTAAERLEAFPDDASLVSDVSEGRVHRFEHVTKSVGKSVLRQFKQHAAGFEEELLSIKRNLHNTSQKEHERATLNLLQYAERASWDSSQVCHPGTRADILEDIMQFLTAPADNISTLRIALLTGVVGCGKTVIAHTVAKKCAENKCPMLGSSFFFSSEFDERRRPDRLFSTISRDICDLDSTFRMAICEAIDRERALASAPMRRQFDGLILKPAQEASPHRTHPLTIVIDALDEGCNEDLLRLLETSVALVPNKFRFFITTRTEATIIQRLRNLDHISLKEINIRANINCQDVKVFVNHALNVIAHNRRIANWLDDRLITRFNDHAEGLFLWASTVCDHVGVCPSPKEELDDILNNRELLDSRATEKMNKLYTNILSKCPWHNRHFARRYQSCLGAVVALKRPLSVSSIGKLLDENADVVLHQLSSLLIGALTPDQPVQIAHSSLRDYLTRCDRPGSYGDARFSISEVENSQHLALRCILTLNRELPKHRDAVAILVDNKREAGHIPRLEDGVITEHVWYACEYWANHIQDIKVASNELREALACFQEYCLLVWVAIGASRGTYFSIGKFYKWSKKLEPRVAPPDRASIASLLFTLTWDFWTMGRLEQALESGLDCVSLACDLAQYQRSAFYPDVALMLYNLSTHHSELGHLKEAVQAVRESVAAYRDLVKDQPQFKCGLALSLYGLSVDLAKLGHQGEALEASRECVTLCRDLARDQPAAFNPDLALAIYHLDSHLPSLGHQGEVLDVVRALRRDLEQDRSSTFNHKLALAHYNFSVHLSNLGRREEALLMAQECVTIRRVLARDRPEKFSRDFARSLQNLSECLSKLDRREEALDARKKAERILATLHPPESHDAAAS